MDKDTFVNERAQEIWVRWGKLKLDISEAQLKQVIHVYMGHILGADDSTIDGLFKREAGAHAALEVTLPLLPASDFASFWDMVTGIFPGIIIEEEIKHMREVMELSLINDFISQLTTPGEGIANLFNSITKS